MKRYIKESDINTLELNIDITYIATQLFTDVAATSIRPVGVDKAGGIIDEEAKEGFVSFVENVFEIVNCYDFNVFDEFHKKSKSFPYTSEYCWLARRQEIEDGNIPKLLKLRISEHTQHLSEDHLKELRGVEKEEADQLKLPKSKKKQRYEVKDIAVNELNVSTYEEALHEVEMMVRKWLTDRGIDVEPYGDPIW